MHHHQWYITTFSASPPLRHHHHNISAPPPLVHHPNTTNHQHNLQYNTTSNIYDRRIWTMSKVRVSSLSLTCELWAKRLAHRILAWPALEVQGATLSATLLKLGFHLEMFHWPNNFWLRLLWVLIFLNHGSTSAGCNSAPKTLDLAHHHVMTSTRYSTLLGIYFHYSYPTRKYYYSAE